MERQAMKKILAVIALLISLPLLTLGVLFLIAAVANPQRILVASVLLVAGALPLTWGLLTLRRQAQISPEALAAGAVELARRLGGEVTVAQMQAEFRIPAEQALETLEKLRSAGQAQLEQRPGRAVYIFRGLQPSLVTRRCPYCGASFSVREALRQCPNCGAALEIDKT